LNVLPINLPSLNDRKKDIGYLLEYFKNYYKGKYTIEEEAKELLENYKWNGNVRELQNFVEYFVNLGKDDIGLEDIPIVDLKEEKAKNIYKEKVSELEGLSKKESFVLEELYISYVNNERIGRRKLKNNSKGKNIIISEGQIGEILKELEDKSYVRIGKGRQGSVITEKGIKLIKDN
jgi:transcriptional regulator with PAS, ATPase and Fis domain